MIFTKTHNVVAAAEHMLTPFMAGCHRIRQFAFTLLNTRVWTVKSKDTKQR